MNHHINKPLVAALVIVIIGIVAAGSLYAAQRDAFSRAAAVPSTVTGAGSTLIPDTSSATNPPSAVAAGQSAPAAAASATATGAATATVAAGKTTTSAKQTTSRSSTPSRPASTPSRDERKPLAGRYIFLDPGHGTVGSGAVGNNGGDEARNNLTTALMLRDMLVAGGARVSLSRTSNVSPTIPGVTSDQLAARTTMANRTSADMFVSLHQNSSDNTSARGLQVYYRSGSSLSLALADRIRSGVIGTTGWRDWGSISGTFYVLRNSTRPAAVLVEAGFISNATDEALISSSSFQRKIATGIYNGIVAYCRSH